MGREGLNWGLLVTPAPPIIKLWEILIWFLCSMFSVECMTHVFLYKPAYINLHHYSQNGIKGPTCCKVLGEVGGDILDSVLGVIKAIA